MAIPFSNAKSNWNLVESHSSVCLNWFQFAIGSLMDDYLGKCETECFKWLPFVCIL